MVNIKCKEAIESIKEYSLKKAIKQKQQEDVAKARGFKSNKDFQDHTAQKKGFKDFEDLQKYEAQKRGFKDFKDLQEHRKFELRKKCLNI